MSEESDPMPADYKIVSCGKSDVGMRRAQNQDSIYLNPENNFFILADGMGGHQGGEEASRLAIEVGGSIFLNPDGPFELSDEDQYSLIEIDDEAARLTRVAILCSDNEIMRMAREQIELQGMGSTIETLCINDGIATIGHVGDSRVYRFRDSALEQVTEDHSLLVQEMKRREMTRGGDR